MEEKKKDLSKLKSMFSDYQKKQQDSKSRKTNLLAKYFVPRNSRELFRILPPKDGKKHIEEAFFHVVPTLKAGGKTKHGTVIYCPKHNDPFVEKLGSDGLPLKDEQGQSIMIPSPCPICDKAKKMLATQDRSIKGIKKENMTQAQLDINAKNREIFIESNKWAAKKFYIVRGIDKGTEKDGVKFWRFKHNFKNQGTLDKLLPILEDYMTVQQADFSDPETGTDLSITMTETEFNGRSYMQITAISARGKSKLHSDSIVQRQWLDDNMTWRDVFKPKQAPGMPPFEFLQTVVNGTNPYWEDTDASNKKWIFPAHPELQKAANTRDRNLDADKKEEKIEMASDLRGGGVTINNITEKNVGVSTDNATDLGKEALVENSTAEKKADNDFTNVPDLPEEEDEDYDDLPF